MLFIVLVTTQDKVGGVEVYCNNCGAEIREGSTICPHCGEPVSNLPRSWRKKQKKRIKASYLNRTQTADQSKKVYSKRKKIAIVASALQALIVVIAASAAINHTYSIKGTAERLESALKSKNVNMVARVTGLDKEMASEFVNSCDDSILDELDELKLGNYNGDNFKLTKKNFLWLNIYKISVKTYKCRIKTNLCPISIYEGTSLVDYLIEEEGTITITPGKHKLVAKYYRGNLIQSLSQTVNTSGEKSANFIFDKLQIGVGEKFKDAEVYVNGEDTKKAVSSYEKVIDNYYIPFSNGDKVQLEMQFPWGKLKTKEFTKGTNSIKFLPDDKTKQLVMDTIVTCNKSIVDAKKARDANKANGLTGYAKEYVQRFIDNMKKYEEYYHGGIEKIDFDLDSFTLSDDSDFSQKDYDYYITVQTREFLNDDTTLDPDEAKQIKYTENKEYELAYDKNSKKFLISGITSGEGVSENIKTVQIDYYVDN